MSTQSFQERYSSKKKREYSSINMSNNFEYGHIPQQSNEIENQKNQKNQKTTKKRHPPFMYASGKEGLQDYVLTNFNTLSPHFSDNPQMFNLFTIINKSKRIGRLNRLDNLAKERRREQKLQSSAQNYLRNVNDDDLLIKTQERLRVKHHDSKNVKTRDCRGGNDDQGNGVNQERSIHMDDDTVNQKDLDTNGKPLDELSRPQSQQSQQSQKVFTASSTPTTVIRNFERLQDNKGITPKKSKKHDSRDHSYKAKLQDKTKRKQELELARKQVIKKETIRRSRQLEEFRQKQRKEKMAQKEAKNRELKLGEDTISDEYKEIRKQKRRERMAEIAKESRDPSTNDPQEQDNENIEYWENLTPDNIGWKEFLSKTSKENDKSQFSYWTLNTLNTLNTEQYDKYRENFLNALAPEKSFKEIMEERYMSRPVSDESEEELQRRIRHPQENEPSKSVGVQIPKSQETKFSSNQKRQLQDDPISKPSLKLTQQHLEEGSSNYPQSIAKVQDWLESFEQFDKPNNSSSSYAGDDYSSPESSDCETSTMGNSKSLLALLSKIRSTKKQINFRDKVALERHQRTLEVMQRIVTDLIVKHEEIIEREKNIKDGKKHFRELLNVITGKNTRDVIDALSQSLDHPPNDFDSTSNSLDALLKQLRKATDGLKNVEGQLTRKEKRLKTALEIAQDLVDKRLDLINWERRLRVHEQRVNEIASHVGDSKNSSMVNQQNSGSGYIGSVLGSFFGKKNDEIDKNQGQEQMDKPNPGTSKLQRAAYTEEDWEKILVRLTPDDKSVASPDEHIDQQKQNKDEYLSDTKSDSTIRSSPEANQMTVISQMDEYVLLLEKHEKMKEYLDKIGDNQQSIKDYLSKVDNDHDNNNSVINSKYFRPNIAIEESTITEIKDDALVKETSDKGKENQTGNLTPLPTFNFFTNEKLMEAEPDTEDSDSDWEELTARFNELSCSRNKLVKQKSIKPTPSKKFPKKVPTTESLVRNTDWEKLLQRIQNKSHLQKTPNWLENQSGKANASSSNFFVNSEGKPGGIFADMSQTGSTDVQNGKIPKMQVIDVENNVHNDETELRSDLTNMGSLTINQKDILTSEGSSSLDLGDYVSRSFPVIPQRISENVQKEDAHEQANTIIPQKELEIPRYDFETQKNQEKKEISADIKDNIKTSDNNVKNDNGIMVSESGLDFSEVVNNLPGWKSFVSLVRGNVDKTK